MDYEIPGASMYSGRSLATLRNSVECDFGHFISHQLIGTMVNPGKDRHTHQSNTSHYPGRGYMKYIMKSINNYTKLCNDK